MTTLLIVIRKLACHPEEATIFAAQPWTGQSSALVGVEAPMDSTHVYFLEVAVAREVLEGWMRSLNQEPTAEEQCERLIQYAINDA